MVTGRNNAERKRGGGPSSGTSRALGHQPGVTDQAVTYHPHTHPLTTQFCALLPLKTPQKDPVGGWFGPLKLGGGGTENHRISLESLPRTGLQSRQALFWTVFLRPPTPRQRRDRDKSHLLFTKLPGTEINCSSPRAVDKLTCWWVADATVPNTPPPPHRARRPASSPRPRCPRSPPRADTPASPTIVPFQIHRQRPSYQPATYMEPQ